MKIAKEDKTNERLYKVGEACGAGAKTAGKLAIILFVVGAVTMRILDFREKKQRDGKTKTQGK